MSGKIRFIHIVPAIAIMLLISLNAFADKQMVKSGQGMSQSLFEPAIDTKGHITMDGSPVLPHLSFSVGLLLDFGFNSWISVEQTGNADTANNFDPYNHVMITRMISARFQANFGLFDRLAVGFQLPIMVPFGEYYELDPESNRTQSYWSNKGTFGDISLHIKASLLRSDWHPIGIAFIAQYFTPSGKSEIMTGEPGSGAFSFKAVIDSEPAIWYRIGLNAGIRLPLGYEADNYLSWNETNTLLFHNGPTFYFGLGQSFNIWPGLMDLVLEFYGNQMLKETGNLSYLSLEGLAGVKFYIEESSFLMAGYAHGIPIAETESGYSVQNMEHRMFLGFCYEPSMDIRIRDSELDRDGDGIFDKDDACPDDPEDMNGIEDEDGCPEHDMDGDGIKDQVDKCPLVPEDKDGDRDEDGCPEEKEYVGSASAGPSATSDRDMDRIVDIDDSCPDEPETYNGMDDEDGCPDQGNVVVTNSSLMILKKVYFEYNSDKIKEISFSILDEVALTINNNPQITGLQIQGHADSRGNDRYNLKLTKRRAAAVEQYLVKKGVDRSKLNSEGYGEYCPVNPDESEAAWEENRRVEFKVTSINNNPTGVKLGCTLAEQHGIH
ncbi:MAG: OmpA family protein [Deltaproteobacteria bacterium]|nr:OmpA family protein [Deltaproteobacteria bacterium]